MTGRVSRAALAIALATTGLGASPALAKKLGAIAAVRQTGGVLELTTRDREIVTIQPWRDDIVRIRMGRDGKLADAGDGKAPIVIAAPQPGIAFKVSETPDYYLAQTAAVSLRIYRDALRIEAWDVGNRKLIWRQLGPVDLEADRNIETLSSDAHEQFFGGGQQNGSFAFKGKLMEIGYSGGWEEGDRPNPAPFFFSSAGYGVLRNSWKNGSYDFRSDDYLVATHKEGRYDAFFLFGGTPAAIIDDYTTLTGRPRMLPRWGYEYGDADCYNDGDNSKKPGTVPPGWSDGPTGKTPDVVASVAAKYRQHDMPGGWILPNDGYGCGYTGLPEVVKGLAGYGFKTGLWTESGVDKIAWEVGKAGTRVQKLDVAWTGKGYQFALDANRDAAQGILDNSDSRPVVWTVMGWAGIQRYAITWTGDQTGSWDYIRWHIPTYIGSGLSGQVYAAGDVDGIFGGSPETFTRDLQWKSFTPVLMGMSGWSATSRKHPWWFEEPYRSINRDYLKLRQRLMPYLYTYARAAEDSGAPIVRGLLWDHPDDPNALNEKYKYQYFYGRDFLVAPVYRSQSVTGGWREGVYLPRGRWIDYWDGRVTDAPAGGKVIDYPVKLETLPVLVRAGAIIPMYPASLYDGQVRKTELTLDIYPAGQSSFSLYEDDGNTRAYQQGASSRQEIKVAAPENAAGPIAISIGAITGQYQGMEPQRAYRLQVHSRFAVQGVTLGGKPLAKAASKAALTAGTWFYDPVDKFGTLHVLIGAVPVAQALDLAVEPVAGATLAATPGYPAMPPHDDFVPVDAIKVIGRPLEEAGKPLENVFDGKPDTWFRTSRDASISYGAPEFTLYLGERRAIDGFDIAPRNDQHWQSGQVRKFEIYVADSNGEWGRPAYTGELKLQQGNQSLRFAPIVGRLLRFRILSTHDAQDGKDPMVLAAGGGGRPIDALAPASVGNVTISEFRLHEFTVPEGRSVKRAASDFTWKPVGVAADKVRVADAARPLSMNGLAFTKGFATAGDARIDITLTGFPLLFRADLGIDDACKLAGATHFQIWGDDRLLFDSGAISAPAVVKPEVDIRGLKRLSLRTIGGGAALCANWANATVVGTPQ